ncbi:MAG: DUF4350 domain-containing protein [Chitinophagaceae bacterium]
MKKIYPYILTGILGVAIIFLFFTTENNNERRFDGRITFRKKDKIPYGTFVAYESLKEIFPKATIMTTRQEPGYWDSLSNYDAGQALIIVCPYFNASKYEMKKLIRFMEEGNDVFISAMKLSYEVTQLLKCDANAADGLIFYFEQSEGSDLLSVSLTKPPFQKQLSYTYPGKRYDFYFYKTDTAVVTVLGHDKNKNPNFIHLKAGAGNLYVHLAPMTFTNYFLLHKKNIAYYENALSVISPNTTKVAWDEYYSTKKQESQKKSNWLSVFFKYPALKWALLTALFALLLYVVLGMRRRQRIIPVIKKPGNDSLEFVKTIGRLYHDKGDHTNLSKKMSAYFLEHVRSRYKLPTSELNEDFEKALHFKTGVDQQEINNIVSFIRQLDSLQNVSDKQLARFHKHLENFYKHS